MTQPSGSAGVKRRDFLKVLGAAGAATTTVGCFQEDVEKLIPYLVSPDDTVPGVSAITPQPAAHSRQVVA
jgi:molybdopterin-containing oxidoreductase family iron-sulfur binding subunit